MITRKPPSLLLRFFRWYCRPELADRIEGDLIEIYQQRWSTSGKNKANIQFGLDVLLLMRPQIIRPMKFFIDTNNRSMYRSYFRSGWRALIRNKAFSYMNVFGLTVGMAVTLLIAMWILDETGQNTNQKNYKRIARVQQHRIVNSEILTSETVPVPLADELRAQYKSDFKTVVNMWFESSHTLSIEDKKLPRNGVFFDKEGLEMFSFEMIKGGWNSLNDPASVVLSEPTAKAIFGESDPINQLLKIDNSLDVKVTGVFKPMSSNSMLRNVDFISTWDLWVNSHDWMKADENNWDSDVLTFVEINEGTTFESASTKIEAIRKRKLPPEQAAQEAPRLFLHPMSKWYLYSVWKDGNLDGGRIQFVWMFGIIGVIVLTLACINFVNLSTAQAEMRAREVGIRKAIGSLRGQLIAQFFIETFLIVLVAATLAIGLATIALPWFNELTQKQMEIPWSNRNLILVASGIIATTSLLAGSYPALFLSSFQPIRVLKGTFKTSRFSGTPRRVLVVIQFSASIALIIGTLTVWQQVQFAKSRPVGYTREGLIMVRKNSPDFWGKTEVLRHKLKEANAIVELAESASPATETWFTTTGFDWSGKNPNERVDFACVLVTHDYGKTVGWNFTLGRDYSREYSTDSSAAILNETAARMIGWENPVNEELRFNGKPLKIIGVVKDMVVDSPYEPVKQSIYVLNYEGNVWLNIRLNPELSTHEAITRVERVFQAVLPSIPFEFKFTDDEYNKKFADEERIGKLATMFTVLAVFISCLGLFGLASFVTQQRTKEIGIRKVMGATIASLWGLLSREFIVTVAISILIAIPVAWYILQHWLDSFQYRTQLSWLVFVGAGVAALVISLCTVSYQSFKAALINPVRSLRSE